MNLLIQLTMGRISMIIFLFFVCGLVSYLIDYRRLKKNSEYPRERNFSKALSYTYVIGSFLAFIFIRLINLFI